MSEGEGGMGKREGERGKGDEEVSRVSAHEQGLSKPGMGGLQVDLREVGDNFRSEKVRGAEAKSSWLVSND
jgi:hypothetical protein